MSHHHTGCCKSNSSSWIARLKQLLPLYGHRNWIVVADSAYPLQSAPGIETIYTDSTQIEVLKTVLEQLNSATHVQPTIMLDAELDSVPQADAPGVDAYRAELKKLMKDQTPSVMPHEEIIAKLDQAAKMFNILLLKTDMTIPYTSVFLQLQCGYWNAQKESRMRKTLNKL